MDHFIKWCKNDVQVRFSPLNVSSLENKWLNVQQCHLFFIEKKTGISLLNLKQLHPHLQTWAWALNNTWCVVHTWQGTTQSITGRGKYFITRLFGICSRMYSFSQKHQQSRPRLLLPGCTIGSKYKLWCIFTVHSFCRGVYAWRTEVERQTRPHK